MNNASHKEEFPYWLVLVIGIGLYFTYRVINDDLYVQVFTIVSRGISITLFVTLVAFFMASTLGLLLALAVLSPYVILRQFARFYIEVVRGIPMLVLLLYIAFVGAPQLVILINWIGEPLGFDPMRTRDLSLLWRAVLALMIGYSAFIAEVFRAGLQSVEIG